MRDATIARNYAETLLTLARRANDLPGWGRRIAEIADAMDGDVRLRRFLESPSADAGQKNAVLAKAFADAPRNFLRFLQALVTHRRQMLIPAIAIEYALLVDQVENRIHARVTLAKEPSAEETATIARQLGTVLGKTVIPHVSINPDILGGIVVRVGDKAIDGSVRRRLASLRSRLYSGRATR